MKLSPNEHHCSHSPIPKAIIISKTITTKINIQYIIYKAVFFNFFYLLKGYNSSSFQGKIFLKLTINQDG